MTLSEAKQLRYGDIVHEDECVLNVGKRGGVKTRITEWRMQCAAKTWKTRPDEVLLSVKHGMYEFHRFTERDLAHLHTPENCPLAGLALRDTSELEMPA